MGGAGFRAVDPPEPPRRPRPRPADACRERRHQPRQERAGGPGRDGAQPRRADPSTAMVFHAYGAYTLDSSALRNNWSSEIPSWCSRLHAIRGTAFPRVSP